MSEQQRTAYANDLVKRAKCCDDIAIKVNLLQLAQDQYKLILQGK